MIFGHNANECWRKAISYILQEGEWHGSRNGRMLEVRGFQLMNLNPRMSLTARGGTISLKYAATELLWYLSRREDIEPLLKVAPQYERFANNGIAMGAYGWRWQRNSGRGDQLAEARRLLLEKGDTRQAVVTMWRATDLWEARTGEWNDIPCTLSLQFLLRNNKLDLIVTMRSNDAWLGLPYDMFCFSELQVLMAASINADVGRYYHQAGSLHIYERNMKKVDSVLHNAGHTPMFQSYDYPTSSAAVLLMDPGMDLFEDLEGYVDMVEDAWLKEILRGALGQKDDFTRTDFKYAIKAKEKRDADRRRT